MAAIPETKKALIVVRTYPVPAKNGAEVSCTAAITEDGQWLRLFPVPWRYLAAEQQFRRYQWIQATVIKASDPRPESYKLTQNGIKILSDLPPDNEWAARREFIEPLRSHCMCCLAKQRDDHGSPTLGIFRPKKIERLIIKTESPNWTQAQLEILSQGHLFEEKPKKQLEKIPYSFRYKFYCDHTDCKDGHTMICTDWEMSEAWRKWKEDYGDGWEAKFRQRFEIEMIEKYDTHLYVGTVKQHPGTWIIVGLFYPPHSTKGERLF
jgi:hypothetical protein